MIKIFNDYDCCGCTACENICGVGAVSLYPNSEGFFYPIVDEEKCVDCHLCEKVCPIINRKNGVSELENQKFYAVRHKDKDILMNSSSGGAFTALAKVVLDQGGIVFGATYDENMVVRHMAIDKIDDLWKFRGSKYVQSDIRGIFQEVKAFLLMGKYVLFSGTPCQIEGLNLFLRKSYETLLTIDLVCHAVSSPLVFADYIDFLQKKKKWKVVWMNMRDKQTNGWNHQYNLRVFYSNKKCEVLKKSDIRWGSIYGSHLASRLSCHQCLFSNTNRPGDITIGDFWDDNIRRADLYSKKGTSVVIINTSKGRKYLSEAECNLYVWSISREEAWQPCLESPAAENPHRSLFWNFYRDKGCALAFKKFFYTPIIIRYKWWIKDHIAKLIGYKPTNNCH